MPRRTRAKTSTPAYRGAPIVHRYSSILAFVKGASWAPVCPANAETHRLLSTVEYPGCPVSFAGLEKAMPLEDVASFWLGGWSEGVDKMRGAMERLSAPVVKSIRRRGRWADSGDDLDRDRLYSGDLDRAWRTTARVSVASPARVRIVVDQAASARIQPDQFFWRGAAAATLAEALLEAGYAVEVACAIANANGEDYSVSMHIGVTLKAFDAPLNMSALVAAAAHASFHRVGNVSHLAAHCPVKVCRGLGSGLPVDLDLLGYNEPGVLTLLVDEIWSQADASAWLSRTMSRLAGAA